MASTNLGRVMGYSAYEIAQQNGYTGTEAQWLASLKGADGEDGTNGTDGVSPVATVERNLADTGAVITITDANGTTTATVNDGTTPSLTGYATETYVDNAVGAIDVPTATSDLTNDSGFITSSDLSGYAQTSSLATVATTGDYDDLTNKPTIPDVSGLATETYVDNAVASIAVPTATSDLTNDSGFVTANDLATVATSGDYDDLINKPTIPAAPSIATAQTAGLVKPDGTTITIDANGTISSAGGGGSDIIPDGQTILMDENNEISTAIGGYRSPSGGEQVFELLESVTPSAWNSTYSRATLTSGQADSSVTSWGSGTYTIEYTYTYNGDTVSGSTTGTYASGASYYLMADSSSTFIHDVGYLNGSYVIDIKAAFTGASVDSLNIYSPITYTYSPIDYHYIPIDNSTITISNGNLACGVQGMTSAKVLNAGTSTIPAQYSNSVIIGNGHSLSNQYTYGALIAGRNNTANSQAIGAALIGEQNSLNSNSVGNIAIGTYNAVGSGAGPAMAFGYSNNFQGNSTVGVGVGLTSKVADPVSRVVLGKFNTTTGSAPFTIGMGTNNNNRVDAMTIDASANTTFAGTVQATDFLDSNGDSIIGGGGSVPVDPEASSNNVYTGDGYWNNAWDTAMNAAFVVLEYNEQVSRERDSFTFTAGEYDDWGAEQLHLVIGLSDTVNVEDTTWEGTMFQDGDDYTDENGSWVLSRVSSNDEYAYVLTSLNSDYSNMNVLNLFVLSHDNFMQTLVELGVPTKSVQLASNEYISISSTDTPSYTEYTIEPVIYPATKQEQSMDTTAIVNDVTPIAATGGGTEWVITNQDLSDPVWTDWFAASGRVMKLWGNGEIFWEIFIDDSETTSPYQGVSGETVSIIKNNTMLAIIIPDMDSATAPTLSTVDLYHTVETPYGLVDYDYIQNEVIGMPPEFPIGHTDTTDPTTYHNTEWQPNRLYFIDTIREEVINVYEDVDVITSSIGTDGMSIEFDSKRDSIKDKALYQEGGIEFSHIEYTDDGQGNITNDVDETFSWTPDSIQLKDRTTGDVYEIYIDEGRINVAAVDDSM